MRWGLLRQNGTQRHHVLNELNIKVSQGTDLLCSMLQSLGNVSRHKTIIGSKEN